MDHSMQTYYFDDDSLTLRRNCMGLRIRVIDGKKASITLKRDIPGQGPKISGYKQRLEMEHLIPLKSAQGVVAGRKSILSLKARPVRLIRGSIPKEQMAKIRPLGSLRMQRATFALKSLKLELDHFIVSGKHFFELEVETKKPSQARTILLPFLRKAQIPVRPLDRSKLGVFLKEWGKSRKTLSPKK